MKRDLDLLRAILLRIEEAESNIENHNFYDLDDPPIVDFHICRRFRLRYRHFQ